jgi:hypothetical protein
LRVVVVHHPAAVPHVEERTHLLRGHEAATRVWAAAGADLVLGGHIHLPFVLPLDGLARRLWVVQAGTAVSTRTRPGVPNSVNLLRWGEAAGTGDDPAPTGPQADLRCRIERWDFGGSEQAFKPALSTFIRPERAGGLPPGILIYS